MIKLTKKISFYSDFSQQYNRKNFAALIFFDFFWGKEKIMSFPTSFLITPWALDKDTREIKEEKEVGKIEKYPEIKYFVINKKKVIYTGILFETHGYEKCWKFWMWFLPFLGEESNYIRVKEKDFNGYKLINPKLTKFESFMRIEVFEKIFYWAEEAQLELLSFIEEKIGTVEVYDAENHEFNLSPSLIDRIGKANRNFCANTPSHIRIDLEKHFSIAEIKEILRELEKISYGNNPFPDGIETSIEEYKDYLETLFGPGKCEYTNLEISKLGLTIEELFFILLKVIERDSTPLFGSLQSPYFIPDKNQQSENIKLLYKYFWYKVKEIIKKVEAKNDH